MGISGRVTLGLVLGSLILNAMLGREVIEGRDNHPSGLVSSTLLLASVKLIGFEVPGTNEGEKPTLPMCGIIECSLLSYNCKSCFEITLTN